ncbi:MAG: DnaB-like helicase N-terminal domain-containing protein, partial [Fusobacterium sp. JB021]|nr:DnaB-like helicase N-terminal domain-containing protein [Fusobacterium sp. JB021]
MEKLDKLKSVPSSLESERAVLGGIFLRPDIYGEVAAVISSQDFYKVGHRYIFDAMAECYGNQESIDPLLVMNRLKKMNKFDEIGGESIFYDILEEVPTAANILSYAAIVKEKSLLRKLGTAGTKIVEMSYEGYEDVDVILDKAESLIFKIAETKDSKDLVDMRQAISDEIKRLEKVMNNKGMTTGISSGFKSFDDKTSGFHPSDLVIVAARPAMGKTALALNMALNMATHEKKGILLFSLEMSSSQLLQRLI